MKGGSVQKAECNQASASGNGHAIRSAASSRQDRRDWPIEIRSEACA